MAAVNCDCSSEFRAKPEVSITRVLRPGTDERFFARLRRASSTLRAPKSASEFVNDGKFGVAPPEKPDGVARDATWIGAAAPFGETAEPFTVATTSFSLSASAGKF